MQTGDSFGDSSGADVRVGAEMKHLNRYRPLIRPILVEGVKEAGLNWQNACDGCDSFT